MFIFVTAVIVLLLAVVWKNSATPFQKDVPTPPSYPIIGNYHLIQEFLDHPVELILRFTRQFGRSWALSVPIERGAVFVHDPKCVEHVLKTNFSNYIKGDEFRARLVDLLGEGIFNSDGEQWRLQRKTASHLFTTRELRGFMSSTFNRHGLAVCKQLEQAADNDEYVDLHDLFYKFTLDSICVIAFGFNLNALGQDDHAADDDDDDNERRPFTHDEALMFAKLFDETQELCERRFYKLGFKWQRYLSFLLPFVFKSEATIRRNVRVLDRIAYTIIADRKQYSDDDLDKRDDLLSLFLKKRRHQETFSDSYLRDVIMNFIIAGRDTTAQALSWAHYMLVENPDVADNVHDEVCKHAGGADGVVDFDVCRKLEYTEAVVCETLRLYPSVPKDIKSSVNDDVLPDGTHVPAKCMIVYSPWTMGRLSSLWGDDAEHFDPERWLRNNGRKMSDANDIPGTDTTTVSPVLNMSPYLFTAFQAGPRTCLGRMVALLEAKMLTALIAQRFKFTLKPGHVVEHKNSLTLPMKNGLLVKVHKRA